MDNATYDVSDVFRIRQRGTILSAKLHGGLIEPRTELQTADGAVTLRVMSVEIHSKRGEVGIVISPDVGNALRPGLVLRVGPTRDIPER
jgi:translation elongation factor EF-1alpha